MIDRLVPGCVATAEMYGDSPEVYLPGEEEAVARAVPTRRREFSSVRHCARTALAELDVPAAPLLRGERGAPCWPAGIVGSMTHCDGYRAAAVARDTHLRSIGIDAEPDQPLPDGVLTMVAAEAEIEAFHRSDAPPQERLLFSAKESVYKAWFPLMRRWLDFSEASVAFRGDGTFTAQILPTDADIDAAGLRTMTGRWAVARDVVLTAVIVPWRT